MARARRAPASKKQADAASADEAQTTFTCPECGKTFTRAASLGAHRNRAHGVAGASKTKVSVRRRSRPAAATASRTANRGARPPRRTGAAATQPADGRVNRDALLQTLFPNGVPAREETIRRLSAWLDEAEQLAASK